MEMRIDNFMNEALRLLEIRDRDTGEILQLPRYIEHTTYHLFPGIDRVIFNAPATIVIWLDGTKTIVKCQEGDTFDEQTGLALCFMKKALGNSSRKFNDILHAYVPVRSEMEVYADNKLMETI